MAAGVCDLNRVQTDELRGALEPALSESLGGLPRIRRVRRRRSPYSSSCVIEKIEVELDRGGLLHLIFKDLSPGALLKTAKEIRPGFLYEPQREIAVYRDVLHTAALGTARCYGALEAPRDQRYWLFLERVDGPLLWQLGSLEHWCEAARWLARLHTRCREVRLRQLLPYNAQLLGMWPERAANFLPRSPRRVSTSQRRRFDRLASRYKRVVQRLLELPQTLIHGEFYPSNVIMQKAQRGRRVCPVDWEVAAIGPGLIDLAALVSGKWDTDETQLMISAYREALQAWGDGAPRLNELFESVRYCQLHLAMQMLGWACDWSAPALHAQDWLEEALRLGDKLGL